LKESISPLTISTASFSDSVCPNKFKVPLKSDLKEIVNSLCSNAYNYLTTTLEFQNNKAYASNTKDPSEGYYYIAIAIEDNSVNVKENDRLTFNCIINCVLDFSVTTKFNNNNDFVVNGSGNIEFISNVIKGSIWRYDNDNNNIK